MPNIAYVEKNFRAATLDIIDTAIVIIDEYQAQGFSLTVRQLYYQFVARDLIANKDSEYKRLASIINDARLAGAIDWLAIEDRNRSRSGVWFTNTPKQALNHLAEGYAVDLWDDQPNRVEIWIEKAALLGVIQDICMEWRVPYYATRGYNSQSEAWRAGRRFDEYYQGGQECHVLHFADHDPSGLDMTADNSNRLDMFSNHAVTVKRLALNMSQVDTYGPPPNPAKITDSRFSAYRDQYGESSWELDALEPRVIAEIIEREIEELVDTEEWESSLQWEREQRRKLRSLAEQFDDS